jgi:hypothetical protein
MYTTRAAMNRLHIMCAMGALAIVSLPAPAIQAQQDPAQPPAQPGQPGQPGGRQGRGGFGNFANRMPFATGQVTGGDPATGTVIIGSPFGGSQTIHVGTDTKMVALVQVDATKLKIGDTVRVEGVPSQITASTIAAGDLPDFLTPPARGRGGPGAPVGAAPGAPQAAGAAAQAARPQPATATATGKISKLEPLTIELSDEVSIVLKLGPNAKIMKMMPATINNIKLGDQVFASGQAGQDGIFMATGLGINVTQMPGMMGGGRGGFGGPGGGFGGFGGGRRGGRGGRGAGANGQGGPGA